MRDPQLPGDVAGPDPVVSEFHDPLPDDVGQRSAVDENAAKLVDAAVTWKQEGDTLLRTFFVQDLVNF